MNPSLSVEAARRGMEVLAVDGSAAAIERLLDRFKGWGMSRITHMTASTRREIRTRNSRPLPRKSSRGRPKNRPLMPGKGPLHPAAGIGPGRP
jgi:hypothetical protein